MADWSQPAPTKPPGPTEPPPTASTPGWAEWIVKETKAVREQTQVSPGSGYRTTLRVERGDLKIFYLAGGPPGPWTKEDVTFETEPPAPYVDFTRYSRTYPWLKFLFARRITVTLILELLDPAATVLLQKTYEFWEYGPSDEFTRQPAKVYRWKKTSSEEVVTVNHEQVTLRKYDGTPPPDDPLPDNDTDEKDPPSQTPPPKLFESVVAGPRPFDDGWYTAVREMLPEDLEWVAAEELLAAASRG